MGARVGCDTLRTARLCFVSVTVLLLCRAGDLLSQFLPYSITQRLGTPELSMKYGGIVLSSSQAFHLFGEATRAIGLETHEVPVNLVSALGDVQSRTRYTHDRSVRDSGINKHLHRDDIWLSDRLRAARFLSR